MPRITNYYMFTLEELMELLSPVSVLIGFSKGAAEVRLNLRDTNETSDKEIIRQCDLVEKRLATLISDLDKRVTQVEGELIPE